jgi:hypothetical protein
MIGQGISNDICGDNQPENPVCRGQDGLTKKWIEIGLHQPNIRI